MLRSRPVEENSFRKYLKNACATVGRVHTMYTTHTTTNIRVTAASRLSANDVTRLDPACGNRKSSLKMSLLVSVDSEVTPNGLATRFITVPVVATTLCGKTELHQSGMNRS